MVRKHGYVSEFTQLATSNVCGGCGAVFASRKAVAAHLQRQHGCRLAVFRNPASAEASARHPQRPSDPAVRLPGPGLGRHVHLGLWHALAGLRPGGPRLISVLQQYTAPLWIIRHTMAEWMAVFSDTLPDTAACILEQADILEVDRYPLFDVALTSSVDPSRLRILGRGLAPSLSAGLQLSEDFLDGPEGEPTTEMLQADHVIFPLLSRPLSFVHCDQFFLTAAGRRLGAMASALFLGRKAITVPGSLPEIPPFSWLRQLAGDIDPLSVSPEFMC